MSRLDAGAKSIGKEKLPETERMSLLGIPGAGKSHCLVLLRDFFETCLGWTHGVQFQFLATQNSMAELIGGGTVHTWGVIPPDKTQAAAKKGDKNVDWDQLFENCLSMRWLIIDECSTLPPGLLALLESFMREKACIKHPYAFRDPRQRQQPFPFGGINMVFAGDVWQLPPVKDSAIFSNPVQKKSDGEHYEAGEQRIFSMFWDCKDPREPDTITQLHELVECKRTKDRWLHAVLMADRRGEETWEMYCFTHGLPTKNPGSWDPDKDQLACGSRTMGPLPKAISYAMDRASCDGMRYVQGREGTTLLYHHPGRECVEVHNRCLCSRTICASIPEPNKSRTTSAILAVRAC